MNSYLANLETEKINKKSINIDVCNTKKILEIINEEDKVVPLAVERELPNIVKAVDAITDRMGKGGRLFYIGAGTSGRIGILDASECPPTFGTDPSLVEGIIAGGNAAVFKAVEGAEDDEELGIKEIQDRNINSNDSVIGITASGRTPFVISAIREAKKLGAITIAVSNNDDSKVKHEADIAITPIVGPEVVMGSTRMKAGTSQKLVLNMITTTVMIKLGKVYGNLMVDLQPTNEKLMDRAVRIVAYATGINEESAKKYINQSDKDPKIAIVMIKTGCSKEEAEKMLSIGNGIISNAILSYEERNKPHEIR